MKMAALIGVSIGWGAKILETELGPQALVDFGLKEQLNDGLDQSSAHAGTIEFFWKTNLYPPVQAHVAGSIPYKERLPFINQTLLDLSATMVQTLQANQLPVVIGGDHTIAVGTWSGVVHALNAYESFGLIWVDAHMDSHTPETSESQAPHGMPLAALLGHGASFMTHLFGQAPKLSPKHVVLIGVRSYEAGEAALLKKLGVRIYFIEEVQERGLEVVCQEALALASQASGGFGVSVDLDGFDPKDAPGVGSPEPNGLDYVTFMPHFKAMLHHPQLKALEIAEYNPKLDVNHQTASLVLELISQLKG